MEAMMIDITRHATKRMSERIGIPRKAVKRLAKLAYEQGLTHKEASGRLHHYLSYVYLTECKGNQLRVYGEYVFLFRGTVLITVFNVPVYLRKAANAQLAKKKLQLAQAESNTINIQQEEN